MITPVRTVRPRPNAKLFAIGAAAPLAVFVVFYARHFDAISHELDGLSPLGLTVASILVVALALLLAAVGGTWATGCDLKLPRTAFAHGLSVSAVVFALSGLFAALDAEKIARQSPRRAASPDATLPSGGGTDEIRPFVSALSIVFNPIGTVVAATAAQTTSDMRSLVVDARHAAAQLERRNASLSEEADAANRRVEALEKRLAASQRDLAAAQLRTRQLGNEIAAAQAMAARASEAEAAVREKLDRLEMSKYQFDELQRQLSAERRNAAAAQEELRKLREDAQSLRLLADDQNETLVELGRAYHDLAQIAGPSAVRRLTQTLGAAQGTSLKLATIQAIRAIPKATRRSDVQAQLERLLSDPSPDVQRAARSALSQR